MKFFGMFGKQVVASTGSALASAAITSGTYSAFSAGSAAVQQHYDNHQKNTNPTKTNESTVQQDTTDSTRFTPSFI